MGKITVVPVQKSSQYAESAQKPIQRPMPAPSFQQNQGVMDKNISLNLRTLLSLFAFLLLMSGSFLVGRYVFPAGSDPALSGAAAVVDTEVAAAEETEPTAELAAPATAEPVPEEAAPESTESAPAPAEETTAPEAELETSSPTGVVITSYSNVRLSFTKVPTYTWYEEDGYGKVTTIWYTIVNGENGIIKPVKFRIKVEGYTDETDVKYVDVPGPDKEIDAGETAAHGVDKILSYSSTVTDPSSLNLQLDLLDENNKVIATTSQEFNLK